MPLAETPAPRTPNNADWRIITFTKPLLWNRSDKETWYFLPGRRYILNANQLEFVKNHIDRMSDLHSGANYNPLRVGTNLANTRILVERCRERGIGDLLFMTGPLNYLRHVSGHTCHIEFFTLADRSPVLEHHPALPFDTPLLGPTDYDHLPHYHYHWFVSAVTEYDEERDQLNVYDALYKQMGADPGTIDPQFKRPSMHLVEQDFQDLDTLYFFIYRLKQLDLRRTPYYVVAPLAHGSLRMAEFNRWLEIISELSRARPVCVIGHVQDQRIPSADMPYGSFVRQLDRLAAKAPIINLLGSTPLRVVAALIKNAVCAVTLDSGPLYLAQALRTPAVSLWGPVNPMARIGYDRDYMDLAIWERGACPHAACFAYSKFPISRCPAGAGTVVCECLRHVATQAVIERVKFVEESRRVVTLGTIDTQSPATQVAT